MVFKHSPIAAVAMVVVALAAGEASASLDQAEAHRLSAGMYEVRWTGETAGKPVSIYVGPHPDAGSEDLKLLSKDVGGSQTVITYAGTGRPYFYVTDGENKGVWTAERVLPLQGGKNFRDLGGYKTASGQTVKWGKVFRSGSMWQLTEADYTYLNDLGIKVVCDFRTSEERLAEPNAWVQSGNIPYWTRDYSMSLGDWAQLLSDKDLTADKTREAIINGYRQLPYEQATAYREMFLRLEAGEIPLAFNCSAGKDRAGTAAALILTALGVPRETIVTDYALSDKVSNFSADLTERKEGSGLFAAFSRIPPDVMAPLMASDPQYIREMLATLEKNHGSVENYFYEVLKLSEAQLARIRDHLLE